MKLLGMLLALLFVLPIVGPVAADADEGILIANGRAKYFKDGEFVVEAYADANCSWYRSDTNQLLGKFFRDAKGNCQNPLAGPKPTPRAKPASGGSA